MARKVSDFVRLVNSGFSINEASKLLSIDRVLPDGSVVQVPPPDLRHPLFVRMIQARAKALYRARKARVSRAEFERYVFTRLVKQGIHDIWDLVRYYEKKLAIEDKYPRGYRKTKSHLSADIIRDNSAKHNPRKGIDTQITHTHRFAAGQVAGYNAAGRFVRYLN